MKSECHFKNIEYYIKTALERSKSRVLIAVAWFTNPAIAALLSDRVNLTIEIISDENSVNQASEALSLCRKSGIEVTLIKDLNKSSYLMHHKFCIIDNEIVITGSYNWTKNANTNNENIVIVKDQQIAAFYSQEFRLLKEMKNPRKSVTLDPKELQPIEHLLNKEMLSLFKTSFSEGKLTKGVLSGYLNPAISNKIRVLHESLTNAMRANAPVLLVYLKLIEKHGVFYRKRSTPEELLEEENRYQLYSVRNLDVDVAFTYKRMKVKAIRKIQWGYIKMMKSDLVQEDEKKIFKMIDFLMKEIKTILDELQVIPTR